MVQRVNSMSFTCLKISYDFIYDFTPRWYIIRKIHTIWWYSRFQTTFNLCYDCSFYYTYLTQHYTFNFWEILLILYTGKPKNPPYNLILLLTSDRSKYSYTHVTPTATFQNETNKKNTIKKLHASILIPTYSLCPSLVVLYIQYNIKGTNLTTTI